MYSGPPHTPFWELRPTEGERTGTGKSSCKWCWKFTFRQETRFEIYYGQSCRVPKRKSAQKNSSSEVASTGRSQMFMSLPEPAKNPTIVKKTNFSEWQTTKGNQWDINSESLNVLLISKTGKAHHIYIYKNHSYLVNLWKYIYSSLIISIWFSIFNIY